MALTKKEIQVALNARCPHSHNTWGRYVGGRRQL